MPSREPSGLLQHPGGANRTAAELTVADLRASGLLSGKDAAKVTILLSLASAVDEKPYSPGLWMEYRGAEIEIRKGTDDRATDDAKVVLYYVLAKVGDVEATHAANSRERGRQRRGTPRKALDAVVPNGRGHGIGVDAGRQPRLLEGNRPGPKAERQDHGAPGGGVLAGGLLG